jgi:hypothetical protein
MQPGRHDEATDAEPSRERTWTQWSSGWTHARGCLGPGSRWQRYRAVDSDRVVRLPYGRPGAESVTHWAALPALPGMTVHHVLGEDARPALRNALSSG